MTLIAAAVQDGKVHILGDSYTSFGHTVSADTRKKVWADGEMVFGAAGHVRSILAFRYGFRFPPPGDNPCADTYMRYLVPLALREHLREHVHVVTEGGTEDFSLGILIGWRGRLWHVSEDLAVTEAVRGYAAIGTGAEVALGCLYATSGLGAVRAHLDLAARAAAEHIESVRAPFFHVVEP